MLLIKSRKSREVRKLKERKENLEYLINILGEQARYINELKEIDRKLLNNG